MIRKVRAIFVSSPFLRMNAIFFVGSMTVAFLNYLYYPVLGRMLPTAQFGELQVAISQLMQMTTLLSVLTLISVNILVSERDKSKAQSTIHELEKMAVYGSVVIAFIVVLAAEWIREVLKFESVWPIIAIAAVFVSMIPLSFRTAFLRAEKDFTGASISGAITASGKLVFSVLLVWAGLQTFGAVAGLLIAQIVAIVYTTWRAMQRSYQRQRSSRRLDMSLLRPHFRYALFVLVVSSLVMFQISIDATIVKYLFSPEEAGAYAGIATIARIVFFLAGATTAVMLSAVSPAQSAQKNFSMLKKSVFLTVVAAGSATVFFCLFPHFTLHTMLGARYDAYAHLLPILSVAIFTASLANLFATYLIATHYYRAIIPVVIGALITTVVVALRHSSIDQVVYGITTGSIVMCLLLAVSTIRSKYGTIRTV